MSNVQDATILVTGANRGIGAAYVAEFLKAGAKKIYLGVRNPDSVADVVAENPDKLVPLKLDVTNSDDIKAAAQTAQDVDILVNNAGIFLPDSLHGEDALTNARKQMDVNYFGVLELTQAFAPILKNNGGGTAITVSSIVGHVTMPGLMTYCASKYAVQSLILSMRLDLAEQGTKVIGVYPGPIDTKMAEDIDMDKFPPSLVAQETIKAIENGEEEVFPDAFAQATYQAFRDDPKAFEKQMAA